METKQPQKAIVDFNQIAHELESRLATLSLAASVSMPYDDIIDYYVNVHIYGTLFTKMCDNILRDEMKSFSIPTDLITEVDKETATVIDKRLASMFTVSDVKGLATLTRMAPFTYLLEDVILTHEDLVGSDNVFHLDEDERYDEGSYNPPRASRAVRDISE